jgi:putative transposase
VPRSRPPYPDEFRLDAVRLVRSGGESVPKVAKDLGISDQTLRNWVRQADVDQGKAEGLTSEEREELRQLRRDNRRLREEREILRKSRGLLRGRDRAEVSELHRFISAEKANHRVSVLWRVLEVSRSGFYAFERRRPCQRATQDERITCEIRSIHEQSRGTYGAPRVQAALRRRDIHISRKRVARLMSREGISGLVKRRRGRTTIRVPASRPHRTSCAVTGTPPEPTSCGWPTSRSCGRGRAGST